MNKLLLATSFLSSVLAFNNGQPGWKLDANGNIELKDGNPIYVDTSGREMTVGSETISELNKNHKKEREAKEAAEQKLKLFDGLDPVKAREAIEMLSKIDQKKLIDAGKVDEVRAQITNEFNAKLGEKDQHSKSLQDRIDSMLISDVFKSSEFVRDGIAVPRDMFEATFRNNFKIEDGKVVAYDKSGNKLFSKQRIGEMPDAEEALQLLVESHPQKDVILKANTGNGSGNTGSGGGKGTTARSIKRADFEKLSLTQKSETIAKVNAGEMQLTD